MGTSIALFDAPELSPAVESLLRLEAAIEAAPEPPNGWFERAALDETDLVPISMFEEGSWTDRRGFLDPEGKGLAVISGGRIWTYASRDVATQLRERLQRASPLDLQRLTIEVVPTPADPGPPERKWSLVRPCFTFFLREG